MSVAPYGSWRSPLSADAITAGTLKLGQVALDGEAVLAVEGRPREQGRNTLIRYEADGRETELTPAPFNVRSSVHEYGGASFVLAERAVYFSNYRDQALYRVVPGAAPALFHARPGARYADAIFDAGRRRLIAVREDHGGEGEPVNTIVAIPLEAPERETVLAGGADFYAAPRLSPDGQQLCWLSWNHPNLPWDGTTLSLARLDADGQPAEVAVVAGGADESVFQPQWSPQGALVFASDRSGWWNLYRLEAGSVRPLCVREAEFGEPLWELGMSRAGFLPDGRMICAPITRGEARLMRLDPANGELVEIETPFREIKELRVGDGYAAFLGGSAEEARSLVRLDLASGRWRILRRGSTVSIPRGDIAQARAIEFDSTAGRRAHAFFYAPCNAAFTAPAGELPPLLVLSHGGPTSQTTPTFNAAIQFWTSRGFAVVDVNYGGSSGYGRDYRRQLLGQWGIVDVDDCVHAAMHLVGAGLVDGERLAIRGGSAGGYTTLCALTFRSLFRAGASHYGVGDLEVLAQDTHKFESRYLDSLIGPYPAQRARYLERSPVHAADRLGSALILFQGLEDRVVPPNQSQAMFEAARAKGLPVAYLSFAGEQHGFRAAATIKRCLEAELYFYGRVCGFVPADAIEAVVIENLA